MKIHLAESSNERGQYKSLFLEKYPSGLLSYYYRSAAQPAWEKTWNKFFDSSISLLVDRLMRIHLTKSGTDRLEDGQSCRDLLAEEEHLSSLLSFAYKEHEGSWGDYWEELMRIHLATTTHRLGNGDETRNLLLEGKCPEHLFSYAYKGQETLWDDCWSNHTKDLRPRVIVDSGAFTAWTSGKTINPREYAEWALSFEDRWRGKMASLQFMNLDVIGDQESSWRNQKTLEALGMRPIPIVTYGADKSHLLRAIKEYPYFALGGLVPYTRQKKKLMRWLDYCFGFVIREYRRTGVMPKVHLLGVTTQWTLQRYPCYSSDSSSWVACLRYGRGTEAGIGQIPRYKESDAAMTTTIHVLKAEIRRFKKMEEDVTKLWKSRGIIWDD